LRATAEPVSADDAAPDEAAIVERIYDAVIEQRLPPGTKLPEAALCKAFGVRRARIRRAFLMLAARNIVDLHANRGAFVAEPGADEAREVFEARRAVERAVARHAADRAAPEDLARLAEHVRAEESAHREHDRPRLIRLSGEFHVLLAGASGNRVLRGVVRELVARTSLIIAMYGTTTENCRTSEHDEILAALGARDAEAAAALMTGHLCRIEGRLDVGRRRTDAIDFAGLFAG
jgi:DNA-binding GntR family transcriptional regulator